MNESVFLPLIPFHHISTISSKSSCYLEWRSNGVDSDERIIAISKLNAWWYQIFLSLIFPWSSHTKNKQIHGKLLYFVSHSSACHIPKWNISETHTEKLIRCGRLPRLPQLPHADNHHEIIKQQFWMEKSLTKRQSISTYVHCPQNGPQNGPQNRPQNILDGYFIGIYHFARLLIICMTECTRTHTYSFGMTKQKIPNKTAMSIPLPVQFFWHITKTQTNFPIEHYSCVLVFTDWIKAAWHNSPTYTEYIPVWCGCKTWTSQLQWLMS